MKPVNGVLPAGHYAICPLCGDFLRRPELRVGFYATEAVLREHYALFEAILEDHLKTHTAEVMLRDD